jgi:hypothetical protein
MQCRKCGAEIAEKALICYRCGTATVDAKYQPAPLPPARGPRITLWIVIAIAAAILLALYVWTGMR